MSQQLTTSQFRLYKASNEGEVTSPKLRGKGHLAVTLSGRFPSSRRMVERHTTLPGKVSPATPEMWARLDHLSRRVTKSERMKQAMLRLKLDETALRSGDTSNESHS